MSQSYFPTRSAVTSPVKESGFTFLNSDKQLKVEDVQEAYIEQKDRLVGAIDATKGILGDLREFNKKEWVVRYPHLSEQPAAEDTETQASVSPPKRPKQLRRSLTFADDPTSETDVVLSSTRKNLTRSITLASIADVREEKDQEEEEETKEDDSKDLLLPSSEFNVLRLDLKLGASGSTSASSLVSQLEKSSIANLLDERIGASVNHIDKLRLRVQDTSSKVLVTGDLNAGKSTFVNALLRREVMPVDQQPCTTAFCEVHDATENGGKEEVHVLNKDGPAYDINNELTFTRRTIAELEEIVAENESNEQMIKLYLADTRAPTESLLNNGVVDISLIDAPGLNRDSLKTTAVFARQEEIDVIVFVVSAENHFTLSSKEFLLNASNEKAYLFIVVNKYDQIKNKEKCRRLVLEQIKQLSPRTYEDAEDLVHFVDSASALQPFTANPAFDDLESSLRSFVLVKRSKSKLQPASTYLSNLLADIDLLAGANGIVADAELAQAQSDLARAKPILEKMRNGREALESGLEEIEEEGATKAGSKTRAILSSAIARVGLGQPGLDLSITLPSYPGLLGVWDYVRDVRKALLTSIDMAVKLAENEARATTSSGVAKIAALGDGHLPEGVERSRRVFMPEAMFSPRHRKGGKSSRRSSGAIVAGGLHGLGIGLAQRHDMLETTFADVFDVNNQFVVYFGDSKVSEEEESSFTALSVVSVGVGALTMVGGGAMGARGLIEGIVRLTDLFGNETARKWAAPVIGAATIGLTAYFTLELPSSIPRTVGRRIKASLLQDDGNKEEVYLEVQAARISRETRKVLRLASWDVRARFGSTMEERSKEVKGAEETERKAQRAKEYFSGVIERTGEVRVEAELGNNL